MPSERVRTTCPTCKTRLTVDTKTGDILSHKKARRKGAGTLEQALDRERAKERQRNEIFSKALDQTRRREELLKKKFDEAKDRAAEQDPLDEILDED
jgi:IS5 family transposase